jgi:uncharacterized protein (TIGR00266 family)
MSQFEITGGVDPLLKVNLEKGETLFAENNAMVAMDASLTLTSNASGGFFRSLGRKFLNDENFFQQKFEANEGDGTVLLAPNIPGDVRLLEVGAAEYMLSDGAYLASTEGVNIEAKSQSIGKALLSRSGGFFIMRASGSGTLAVSGFGSIREMEVTPERPLIIDNGHLVAWDANLDYSLTLNTAHKGFFGKLVESATTGEGIVLTFTGHGKVLVCSRNRGGFLDWIIGNLPETKSAKNS